MRTRTARLLLPALLALTSCAATGMQQGRAASGSAAASGPAASPTQADARMCTASQLALSTDGKDGDFNGMSHSGTLVVLRNTGSSACRVQPFPNLTFADASGPLKITFTAPGARFMHPGPVVFPITVAPGAQISSALRWVSGPVYASNNCLTPTTAHLRIQGTDMTTPLAGTVCGDATKDVEVEASRWQPGTSATGQ